MFLETFFQVVFQIVLLLLASTDTGTTVGLKEIFKKDAQSIPVFGVEIPGETLLGLSITFSVRTCIALHVKSVKISKGFLLIKPYLTVLLWSIVSVMKRMMVMVVFFIPPLGLGDLLYHWKSEQKPFAVSIQGKLNATRGDMLYMYNVTPIPWSYIDRSDYTDPTDPIPPPYTLYTGIDAGQAFGGFWLIIILHATAILVIKLITVEKFYKSNTLEIILHCLENCNIPQPWRDWDEGEGTVEEHKKRFSKVRREVVSTMAVNLLFNMVMLVPMIYTGDTQDLHFKILIRIFSAAKIWERHGILERSIGVLPQEIVSYINATKLLLISLVTFFILSVLELIIYLAYNKYVSINIQCMTVYKSMYLRFIRGRKSCKTWLLNQNLVMKYQI